MNAVIDRSPEAAELRDAVVALFVVLDANEPPPPAIVIVLVAPVPDATTPDPTKSSVVAKVDNAEPSSSTVIPETTPLNCEPSP